MHSLGRPPRTAHARTSRPSASATVPAMARWPTTAAAYGLLGSSTKVGDRLRRARRVLHSRARDRPDHRSGLGLLGGEEDGRRGGCRARWMQSELGRRWVVTGRDRPTERTTPGVHQQCGGCAVRGSQNSVGSAQPAPRGRHRNRRLVVMTGRGNRSPTPSPPQPHAPLQPSSDLSQHVQTRRMALKRVPPKGRTPRPRATPKNEPRRPRLVSSSSRVDRGGSSMRGSL